MSLSMHVGDKTGEAHLEAGVCGAGHSGGAVEAVLKHTVVTAVQLIQDRLCIVLQARSEEDHLCTEAHINLRLTSLGDVSHHLSTQLLTHGVPAISTYHNATSGQPCIPGTSLASH